MLFLLFTLLLHAIDLGSLALAKLMVSTMFLDVSAGKRSDVSTGEVNQDHVTVSSKEVTPHYPCEPNKNKSEAGLLSSVVTGITGAIKSSTVTALAKANEASGC